MKLMDYLKEEKLIEKLQPKKLKLIITHASLKNKTK